MVYRLYLITREGTVTDRRVALAKGSVIEAMLKLVTKTGTATDPAKLEAFAALLACGMTQEQIRRLLKISRRTYFYRLAEIKAEKEKSQEE